MRIQVLILAFAGLGLLSLTASCIHSQWDQGLPESESAVPEQLRSGLPQIPVDSPRQPAAEINEYVFGRDTFNRSLNSAKVGSTLELTSAPGQLSWGIWQISSGTWPPGDLHVVLSTVDEVWVALADYDSASWEFSGPFAGGFTLQPDNLRHRSAAGNIYIAVMVWDGTQAAVESIDLDYENDWLHVTVDSSGVVGQFPSLVVVDDRPAIAYFDGTNTSLKYVRADNAEGTDWGTPTTVDNSGPVGAYSSMAVVNGNPAISYGEDFALALHYVRAVNSTGTDWGTPVNADATAIAVDTHLTVVNGNPAISYYDDFNPWGLKYVRATDAGGAAWGAATRLFGGQFRGTYTSLAVEVGNPVISYYDEVAGDPMLVGATDADGSAWDPPQPVDSDPGSDAGSYASGEIVDGRMAISYFDATLLNLKYAWYSVPLTAWQTVTVDNDFHVGQHTSLAVVGGVPAIAYYDVTKANLKYVAALDATGADWGVPEVVDSIGDVGTFASLAEVDGRPAIAYFEATGGNLKYAIKSI